ncbi:MAG TPA: hypothetical protein VI454_13095 [Verrucomicrobiae bacterium]|jgi:hypothetical protein
MRRVTTILPERTNVLLLALVGSLLFHVGTFFVLDLGIRLSWWSAEALPLWLRPISSTLPAVKVPTLTQSTPEQQAMPLIFVDVSPDQATADSPKDTKFYSSANSLAANPDIKIQSTVPNITGEQKKMIRTQDTPQQKSFPLQPTPAPTPEPKTTAAPEPKATAPKPGELALAKPADSPTISDDVNKRVGKPEETAPERPRRVDEAKRRLNMPLAGQKMKQEGGVKHRAAISSLDVLHSPFGRYDEAFIKAVQNRWYDLIDERRFAASVAGDVVVKFVLHDDGRITAGRIESTTVDVIMTHICQKAIEDPAPFDPWPTDMRRLIGATQRELTFTFHYY